MKRADVLVGIALSVLAVAGLLAFYAAPVGRGPAPASDPGQPVAVHAVQGRAVSIPPMNPYRRPATSWPAAQTATAAVADLSTRAGDTPVSVGPAQSTTSTTNTVSQVQVTVASQQTAIALGVHGVVFGLVPAGGSGGGRLHVSVDYARFANAYGGDFASRLHLVELPACALITPRSPSCRQQTPITAAASNDMRAHRVGGDVTVPAPAVARAGSAVLLADTRSAGVVLAATAAVSGSGGDFSVMPFSDANEWVNGASSGTFSYDYSVQIPAVPGGFAPTVRLNYSSQMTDGLTSSTNNQASWLGDGWDYVPGFIEEDYPRCQGPGIASANLGDLCAMLPSNSGATWPLTLSLNGTQTAMVPSSSGWRAEADAGATLAFTSGYWVMTQRDGTKYYFGRNQLPGYSSGDAQTSSQWTVPLWHPAVFGGGTWSAGPWRWMLDYATDRHGNAIAYFYTPQTNWYAEAGGGTGTGQYTRGGTLAKITYGFPDGHAYDQAAPGQVTFSSAGGRQDAPTDLACQQAQACGVTSPTMWNDQQLTTITTQALVNGTLKPVDSWALSQTLPATNDPLTASSLWLSSITRSGQDGATPITLPPTRFSGTAMPNRVMSAADTTAGYSPITRFRLTSVTNPTGAVATVAYTPQDPACASQSGAGFEGEKGRCFPVAWTPPGGTVVHDWFDLYAVASKTVTDTTGGAPPVVTTYTDGGPAWHYNTDTVARGTNTWDQWRGFRTVTTQVGTQPDPVSQVTDTYFQGMSKDGSGSIGYTPILNLTSSQGATAEDANGNAGMVFEEITYNGAGGGVVSDAVHNAAVITTTASGTGAWSDLFATISGDTALAIYTPLAGGGTRVSTVNYTRDTNGLITEEFDVPDTSDPTQSTCTTKTYGAFDLITEQDTYGYAPGARGGQCVTIANAPSLSQAQAHAVSATHNTYDTAGNLTAVATGTTIAASTGGCGFAVPYCWVWQTTQTGTYDSYGRVMTSADADNRTTATTYTPAAGAEPASVAVTDPMNLVTTTTYDQARELPLTVADPAGDQSAKAYDALGRPTATWTPGNPTSGPAVQTWSYTVSNTAASFTTQQTEMPGGGYLTTDTINDSIGRPREVQQQTTNGGCDVTDTTYNTNGSKALVSSPYYVSSGPSGTLVAAASSNVPSQTGYVYDGAGRVVKQIAYHLGTQTWETDTTYGGDHTTVVPPAGGTAQTTFTDGRGLTTAIYQYHAGVAADPGGPASGYDKTTYAYTAAKKLSGIADAAGNAWSFTYDLFGNQLTESTPDAGTATRHYDLAGQVMSATDARGKTVSYAYDNDGRRTAEYDTTGGAAENVADQLASWTYDSLAKGKLASSTSFQNGASYTEQVIGYTSQGLPSGTSIVIPSAQGALAGTYTQQYTYAPTGQQTSYTDSAAGGLPSETVTTGYDAAGRPNSLTGTSSYVTGLSYTNVGEPLQYTLGSSAEPAYVTDTYDPQTNALSEQNTQTGAAQVSVDDLHYSYDQSGNVTSEADAPAGAGGAADVQCFQTDYLGRLVQAWAQGSGSCVATPSASAEGGAAPYWNTYGYDVTGNMTGMTSTTPAGAATTTTSTYPAAGSPLPHAVANQSVAGPSGTTNNAYTYDNAGHLTGVTGIQNQTLTWNDAGQLTQDTVTATGGGGQNTGYVYDPNGGLLVTADPGTVTLSLPDEELSLNTGTGTVTGTRFYRIGGTTIATRTGASNVAYLAGDQQGTASVAIDATTLNVTRRWYDPYGSPRGTAAGFPAGRQGFVGGTADTATGLTNLGAREYQPGNGSFVSPDSVLKPYEPGDLNPYAYSNDSPATFADPSGNDPCQIDPTCWSDAQRQAAADSCPSNGTRPHSQGQYYFNDTPICGPPQRLNDKQPWSVEGVWGSIANSPKDALTYSQLGGAVAGLHVAGYGLAADLLEHYLDNSGEAWQLSAGQIKQMLNDVPEFNAAVQAAKNYCEKRGMVVCDSGWRNTSIDNGKGKTTKDTGWYYALGSWDWRVHGWKDHDGKWHWTLDVFKAYHWGNPHGGVHRPDICAPGGNAQYNSWLCVNQNDIAQLNADGWARDYNVWGTYNYPVG